MSASEFLIFLLFLVGVFALVLGVPLLLTAWSIRRRSGQLAGEVGRFLGDGTRVERVATARVRYSTPQFAVIAGLIVFGLAVGGPDWLDAVGWVAVVAGVVLAYVWYKRRLIATVPGEVVVLSAERDWIPTGVVARMPIADWNPRRSWGERVQSVGGEVLRVDTFAQRDLLPDAPAKA